MTVLAFCLLVAVAVVLVAAHRKAMQRIEAKIEAQLLERQKAMEKQGRALIREHERTRRQAAAVMVNSEGLHAQIQQVLCDERIQRVLSDGR